MKEDPKKHKWLYRNSLTIVFLGLFLLTWLAQAVTGWRLLNQEIAEEGGKTISMLAYMGTGHFISATFENFQSEFLQMAMYVVFTVFLRQIGSAESKKLEQEEEVDRDPIPHPDAPWPVKKGGVVLKIYQNSLSLCFLLFFLISWGLHLYGSWEDYNLQQALKHKPEESLSAFLAEPTFWFETFQNWQSEFLSVASIVLLTVFLRQKGSSESKPVDAPHMETGK